MISVITKAESQILNINIRANDEKESEKIANKVAKVFKKKFQTL